MKFFENNLTYEYSFPAVTLAYFLRYPNPYSRHVLSTDVIDRYVDPTTKRLHTTRLHLKKSKVPAAMLKFLPAGLAGPGGAQQSYVVEKSVIDVREGWMEAESRNMEWTGILSVIERQSFQRQLTSAETRRDKVSAINANDRLRDREGERTSCITKVSFKSRLGQSKRKTPEAPSVRVDEDDSRQQGFFASWSTSGIQRTIELIGVKRTKKAILNGSNGMNVVLERLRRGGVVCVLEGMRSDRGDMMGGQDGHWRSVWMKREPEQASSSARSEPNLDHDEDHDR